MAHDVTRPPRLVLIGTPGHDLHRLCVQVRTRSKSIEFSFNRIAVNLDSKCGQAFSGPT